MNLNARRLTAELKTSQRENSSDFYVFPDDEDSMKTWRAFLMGPKDTPYQNGVFEMLITLDENYPLHPPKVRFLTKIFHPNIQWVSGEVCIDILKTEWSPVWSMIKLGKAISDILVFPNAESPLNCDAGNMIRCGDDEAFRSTAELCVEIHSIPKDRYLALFNLNS